MRFCCLLFCNYLWRKKERKSIDVFVWGNIFLHFLKFLVQYSAIYKHPLVNVSWWVLFPAQIGEQSMEQSSNGNWEQSILSSPVDSTAAIKPANYKNYWKYDFFYPVVYTYLIIKCLSVPSRPFEKQKNTMKMYKFSKKMVTLLYGYKETKSYIYYYYYFVIVVYQSCWLHFFKAYRQKALFTCNYLNYFNTLNR